MNSSNKFAGILIITIAIVSLLTSVVRAQESPPSSLSTASPSLSLPGQETEGTLYGQVTDIASDKKSFTFKPVMHFETTVTVDQNTIYSIIEMSPFILYGMIEILSGIIGQKALAEPISSPVMPDMSGAPVPGSIMDRFSQERSFENVTTGDTAVVMGISDNNPTRKVYILKFPENIRFAERTISAFSDNALVVTPPSPAPGPAVSLGWDNNSRITIHFSNKDSGVQHYFSVYNNRNAVTVIFKGAPITGPGDTIYQFTAPDINATYFFRCDIHPGENGQLMVGEFGE